MALIDLGNKMDLRVIEFAICFGTKKTFDGDFLSQIYFLLPFPEGAVIIYTRMRSFDSNQRAIL